MSLDSQELQDLALALSRHPAVAEKAGIDYAYSPAVEVAGGIALGDDCAAIPDPVGGGHLLFAAEGMLPSFVEDDPWFAGYCAVMVNLSDIAAMGGHPLAITDVLASPSDRIFNEVWAGIQAASKAYDVPIVGGHTTRLKEDQPAALSAAVLGRAGDSLITSFDANPGDHLIYAVDMGGAYRKGKPFWNASTTTAPERLRQELGILPKLAALKLCKAGKDVSNGGIIGTLAMLCQCSEVGVSLDLGAVPVPEHTTWEKWLISFPSYGYLLAVSPEHVDAVGNLFAESEVTVATCGVFTTAERMMICVGDHEAALTVDGR